MRTHCTLQVELIPDLSLTYEYINAMPKADNQEVLHTKIRPIKRFVRQPYLKLPSLIVHIEFCNRQTRPIHRNRVANMTIPKNRRRVPDGEGAPSSVSYNGDDGSEVFDLDPMSV